MSDTPKPKVEKDECPPTLLVTEAIAILDTLCQVDVEVVIRNKQTEDFFGAVMRVLEELRDMLYYKLPTGNTPIPEWLKVFEQYTSNQLDLHRIMSSLNLIAFCHGGTDDDV